MTQENDRRNRAEQMASIIRQNLKRAITRQGVSQQEVARKAGMNPASFSQMLNGNKRLLFEDMYAVCDVLGLNIADLMDRHDIDGVLVGNASLDPDSFLKLVNYK